MGLLLHFRAAVSIAPDLKHGQYFQVYFKVMPGPLTDFEQHWSGPTHQRHLYIGVRKTCGKDKDLDFNSSPDCKLTESML